MYDIFIFLLWGVPLSDGRDKIFLLYIDHRQADSCYKRDASPEYMLNYLIVQMIIMYLWLMSKAYRGITMGIKPTTGKEMMDGSDKLEASQMQRRENAGMNEQIKN